MLWNRMPDGKATGAYREFPALMSNGRKYWVVSMDQIHEGVAPVIWYYPSFLIIKVLRTSHFTFTCV